MIRKIDLFKMMFYTLDAVYDETKNNDLGRYLSLANPFAFKGECSADSSIYSEFCKIVTYIDEADYGYHNVLDYLKKIEEGKLARFFLVKTKREWTEAFQKYLKDLLNQKMKKYIIKHSILEDYLNLKIIDQKLFPDDAPKGTSFYDLQPENDEPQIVKFQHVKNVINMYIEKEIDFTTLSEWIDSVIALELFKFDDSNDDILDKVAGIVYSIDDLKEDKDELNSQDLIDLLSKYNY